MMEPQKVRRLVLKGLKNYKNDGEQSCEVADFACELK